MSSIPLVGIYFTLSNEDNMVELIVNIIAYMFKPKIYLYRYKGNVDDYELYKSKKVLVVKRNNKWYNLKSIIKR